MLERLCHSKCRTLQMYGENLFLGTFTRAIKFMNSSFVLFFRLLFSFFNFSLFDINNPQNLNLNLNFFILRIYAVHQTMVHVKKPEFTYEFTK